MQFAVGDCPVLANPIDKLSKECGRFPPKGAGDLTKLHDIDAPLTSLDVAYVGLIAAQDGR